LVDHRAPMDHALKITDTVRGAIVALARTHPEASASRLCDLVHETSGVKVSHSRMREVLLELDLARPRGRPRCSKAAQEEAVEVTSLALAGGEMLAAVDEHLGAVEHLTRAMADVLEHLPAPEGPVKDDRAGRDAQGRFTKEYNLEEPRENEDLGQKFRTVDERRKVKDLREMRLANSSFTSLFQKNRLLTFLPLGVETARWSSLSSWQGEHMGPLVGHAYMPSTLDKHARELKLAGVAESLREAAANFWMEQEKSPDTGWLLAYIDASIHPVWTHHFTRCTKVSSNGRVMPGVSTVWLNSGAGTPLIFREYSGNASVPQHVTELLEDLERGLGEGMVSRLVVLDRESHATWLFKELVDKKWDFIVPLRKNVTLGKVEHGDWVPYGETGDHACEGLLSLRDSRKGEAPLTVRVVGRRRHRTKKEAWYATMVKAEDLPAADLLDLYFARWPLQELVFRDGKGRVGLDVHHGYGKKKVSNVAVLTRREKLLASLERLEKRIEELLEDGPRAKVESWAVAEREFRAGLDELEADMSRLLEEGETPGSELAELYEGVRRLRRWVEEAREVRLRAEEELRRLNATRSGLEERRASSQKELSELERRTTIYTVDTELDEIMTAFKLTFMNLCFRLMDDHLGKRMELDTLIRSVLTLPGERRRTRTVEKVCIYRQERDLETMALVQRACESLTALELQRGPAEGQRRLVFEVVAHPGAVSTGRPGSN